MRPPLAAGNHTKRTNVQSCPGCAPHLLRQRQQAVQQRHDLVPWQGDRAQVRLHPQQAARHRGVVPPQNLPPRRDAHPGREVVGQVVDQAAQGEGPLADVGGVVVRRQAREEAQEVGRPLRDGGRRRRRHPRGGSGGGDGDLVGGVVVAQRRGAGAEHQQLAQQCEKAHPLLVAPLEAQEGLDAAGEAPLAGGPRAGEGPVRGRPPHRDLEPEAAGGEEVPA